MHVDAVTHEKRASMEQIALILLSLALILATVYDLREQRIPNAVTLPVMAFSIIYFIYLNGLDGFLHCISGLSLGLVLLLPFYIMDGMGAGDVKLMGAVGSIMGPQGVFVAFLYSAIVGGVYALFILARSKALSQTVRRYGMILKGYLFTGQLIYIPPNEGRLPPLCYGLAISIGTVLSVLRPLY
jgi:prepilin peptidase CpaA